MRTGDTAAKDRQKLIRRPPDLLITTPESLYLMLTSSAADTLVGVETVIIDEIHALAPTKRGAHLALSLERLEEVTAASPQRIGLSATQRPLEEVARFLGGWSAPGAPRDVAIVDAGISQDAGDRRRHPGRGHGRPRPGRATARRPAQRPRARRRGAAPHEHLAEHLPPDPRPDPRAPLDDHLLQRPPPDRAPRRQAQRAGRRGGHRRRSGHRADEVRAGQGAPRLACPRAAGHRRGRAEARRPARHRRHEQPRARHRHGRRRPRHPGRVAGRGVAAACSASGVPGTRSASRARARSTPSTAATCSKRRSSRGGCSTARSSTPATCATRSTCSPSRSSPTWRRSRRAGTSYDAVLS